MDRRVDEQVIMRIFIGENDRHGHSSLHEALVNLFQREGCAGATVVRGVGGFGAHSSYHTDRVLRLANDLPLIIEVVESQEKLDILMPQVEAMMNGGMITLEKASVIRYGHHHPQ